MNSEEKAKELFDKFFKAKMNNHFISITYNEAKQCALICVEEIIKSEELAHYPKLKDHVDNLETTSDDMWIYSAKNAYWKEVKSEIEKL